MILDSRARYQEQSAKDILEEILKDTESILAKAICKYFEKWDPEKAKDNPKVQERWEELNDGGNIILECEIIMHKMMKKIQKTWEDYQERIKRRTNR